MNRSALWILAEQNAVSLFRLLHEHNLNHIETQTPLDMNITNRGGWTPLMIAANKGHVDMVRELCDKGADPTQQTRAGKTAKNYAENKGFTEIAEFLEEREALC